MRSTACSGSQQRKHQSSALLAYCKENTPVADWFLPKWVVMNKHFHVITSSCPYMFGPSCWFILVLKSPYGRNCLINFLLFRMLSVHDDWSSATLPQDGQMQINGFLIFRNCNCMSSLCQIFSSKIYNNIFLVSILKIFRKIFHELSRRQVCVRQGGGETNAPHSASHCGWSWIQFLHIWDDFVVR